MQERQPRYLLDLKPCRFLDDLSDATMAKLLYRDTVHQKHSEKGRLATEVSEKTASEPSPSAPLPSSDPVDPPSEILVDFLDQAGGWLMWSAPAV